MNNVALTPLHGLLTAMLPPLHKAAAHPWTEAIVRFGSAEDVLRGLHPMLSLHEVRARVVKVITQSPSTKTFVLHPNMLWRGARAGQFVRVRLQIDGRRVQRAYSLSSMPGQGHLAITVKRHPGGLASNHLHDHVHAGDVLTLSQAMGGFTWEGEVASSAFAPATESTFPAKILLLSAGSGITPVMAMLRDLKAQRYDGDVVFVHACHSAKELIFGAELRALASTWPAMRLELHFSEDRGRLHTAQLMRMVSDLSERSTWLCGPSEFMDEIHHMWVGECFASPLRHERFVSTAAPAAAAPGAAVRVNFQASGRQFSAVAGAPLLNEAERAGLMPKHGCRIGICRSCQCTKRSGTVENLQSGAVSSAPDELIRLCITSARSDVTIDL